MEKKVEIKNVDDIVNYKPRSHWFRNSVIALTVLAGAAVWGDAYNITSKKINDISLESIYWSGTPAAEDTPADFFNYKTKIEVDEDGKAVLYFGNIRTDEFLPVRPNGRVGSFWDRQRSLLQRISEKTDEKLDEISQNESVQKTSATLKRLYETARDGVSDFVEEYFGD